MSPPLDATPQGDFPPLSTIQPNPDYVPRYKVEPARWTYDLDPVSGTSRASFPGAVVVDGNPIGGPTTGSGNLVLQTSPTIITPTITTPTISNPTMTGTVSGAPNVVGTATNNNAPAGSIGEYLTATVAVVAVTSGVTVNVVTLVLTAGDWDVEGTLGFTLSATASSLGGWLNTVSVTPPTQPSLGYASIAAPGLANGIAMPTGAQRFSLAGPATIYLSTYCGFTGTCSANGVIRARRMR